MGNENSSKKTTESVPNYPYHQPSPDGSVPNYPYYQPPQDGSFPNYSYPAPIEKSPIIYDRRNYDSQTKLKSKTPEQTAPNNNNYYQQPSIHQSRQPPSTVPGQQSFSIANKEGSTPTTERSSSIVLQKPLSSNVSNQQISSASHNTSNNISSTHTVTSSSFERAPMVQLNYVVKSSDNKSIHTYGPDNMTVMHRTSSQSVPNGNRWYDKDYNKSINPLVTKNV